HFVIWDNHEREAAVYGAVILQIEYGSGEASDVNDRIGDASKARGFLNGTIMNSTGEAIIEIANPGLQSKITLDMSDPWHPRRTSWWRRCRGSLTPPPCRRSRRAKQSVIPLLEKSREEKRRKLKTFRELMVTRSTALSPRHVEALNAIQR